MTAPEILFNVVNDGGCATLTLNRAAKLNALNINMIRLLHGAVDEVDRRSGSLGTVIMEGAGGKAFCAGGDVAEVRDQAMAGGSLPNDFFFEEYAVVHRLATMLERVRTVQVSLWDGITMGGGVGLSWAGRFRVCTERTVFAKPEMAIGLFPDVGSTQKLGRLKLGAAVGNYIGATGVRLNAWDLMRAGIATHFVPAANIPKLRKLLEQNCKAGVVGDAAVAVVEAALAEAAAGAQPPKTKTSVFTDENLAIINKCFDAPTLEDIMARLSTDSSAFAATTFDTMKTSCSPISCKVTLRALRELGAEGVSFGQCLQVEYRLSQRFTLQPQPLSDFWEGIRAVLVDKDRKQNWQPGWNQLGKITDEKVAAYFAPLAADHRRGELVLDHITAWSESERAAFPEVIVRQSKL